MCPKAEDELQDISVRVCAVWELVDEFLLLIMMYKNKNMYGVC